jgi:hypothetical protein
MTTKYRAGDFVNQANPRKKPRIKDKSKRGYLVNRRRIKREAEISAESKLSGRARRSKKNE